MTKKFVAILYAYFHFCHFRDFFSKPCYERFVLHICHLKGDPLCALGIIFYMQATKLRECIKESLKEKQVDFALFDEQEYNTQCIRLAAFVCIFCFIYE
jgi:hypothetical protein